MELQSSKDLNFNLKKGIFFLIIYLSLQLAIHFFCNKIKIGLYLLYIIYTKLKHDNKMGKYTLMKKSRIRENVCENCEWYDTDIYKCDRIVNAFTIIVVTV